MSLERKDIRAKLDAEMHEALSVISDADHLDLGEWVEQLIVRELKQRIHAATVIAEKTAHLGITGKSRDRAGKPEK